MGKLCIYLEKAFSSMNILYKKVINDNKIFYKVNFPEASIFCGTVNLVIDNVFSAEISAFVARGISQSKRAEILESINEINEGFQFISVAVDKSNDVYSYQQFILAGGEDIMCKQIITNLVAFYDLHRRAAQKIHEVLNN